MYNLYWKEIRLEIQIQAAWLECSSSVGPPFNDLMLIKDLKFYEKVNKGISTVGLKIFSNHLWQVF